MKILLIAALSTAVIAVGAAQAFDTVGGSTKPAAATVTTEDRTTTTEDRTAPREPAADRRREDRREDRAARREDRAPRTTDTTTPAPAPSAGRVDNSGPGSANSGRRRGADDDGVAHPEVEVEHGPEVEAEHGTEVEAGDDHGGRGRGRGGDDSGSGHSSSGHGGSDD